MTDGDGRRRFLFVPLTVDAEHQRLTRPQITAITRAGRVDCRQRV
jgi:hypothetical protein